MIAARETALAMKTATALLILILALPAPAGDDVLDLYDIRDLAKSENRPAKEIADRLEDVVEGITDIAVREGVLVVKAPAAVHEAIANYLDALRASKDDILRVFPVEDLVVCGHRAKDLAMRFRGLAPKAKVNLSESKHYGRTIVVAAPLEAHKKIDAYLKELRARDIVLVAVEARLLKGGERIEGSGVRYLDDDGFAAFMAEVRTKEDVTIVSAPKLSCYNGQRAKISIGKERNFVKDVQVRLGEKGEVLTEPVVETIFEGFALDLRPVLSLDRDYVTLVVDARLRRLLESPHDSLSRAAKGKTVDLNLPEIRETRRRTTVTLPLGDGVLLDLGTGPGGAEGGRLKLLLRVSRVK